MSETIAIEVGKLDASPKNVRKTYNADTIAQLAANIAANGLLQNLIVYPGTKKGRYFVAAGERRRRALVLLIEQGTFAKGHAVECKVRDSENAVEISLSENDQREAMHPVDQFEAFKALVENGKTVADVAARFGVTEIIVRRRLALAKVSPTLLELYRNGEMDFEQLSAFTLSDDHERQEQVWHSLGSWNRQAYQIKSALARDEVSGSDKRVKFIGGLDAYEQAGGAVRRDLFDEQNGGFALDAALLDKLASEKLNAEAEPYRSQGWQFVEACFERPGWIYSVPRIYPKEVELSEAEQAERERLCAEHDELADAMNAEVADESASERIDAISARLDELDAKREVYSDEDKARSGVVISLGYHGKAEIFVGVLRDVDDETDGADAQGAEGSEASDSEARGDTDTAPKLNHSAALIEDLTAQRTAALRVELAGNPEIALVAVVHAMLLRVGYDGYVSEQSALQLSLTHERIETSMKQPQNCKASDAFDNLRENYGYKIPGNPGDLFEWCLERTHDELLSLLAYAAAHSLNAVEKKFNDRKSGIAQSHQLARALKVDMGEWFETTAESYFSHINRSSIQAAVSEVRGREYAASVAGMKKAEAAAFAERAVKGRGWLPPLIRIEADQKATSATGDHTMQEDDTRESEAQPFPMAAE